MANTTEQTVLTFDGADDYITCGEVVLYDAAAFTIEFWAKRAVNNTEHRIVSQGSNDTLVLDDISTETGFDIGFEANNTFSIDFVNGNFGTAASLDTDWHHWSCIYNPGARECIFYRDGAEVDREKTNVDYEGGGPLYIGRGRENNVAFRGQLTELRVWDTVRSQAEIQNTMNYRLTGSEDNLLAYWPLNEGEGSSVKDRSPNSHDGTISGDAVWAQADIPLSRNSFQLQLLLPSLLFDGAGDYADCGSGIDLSATSFTIEFYGKREEGGKNQMFVNQGQGSGSGGLYIGFRDSDAFTFTFGGQELNTETTYTDLCWHRWSCVYDSSTNDRIIYRNGEEVARDSHSGTAPATGTFYLGFGKGGAASGDVAMDGFLDGKLVDLRIWKRVLTQAEIREGINYGLTGREIDLVAYWPLNEGQGSTVADQTGNGHDGTLHNVGWARLTRSPGTGLADYGYWYRWKLNIPVQTGSTSFQRGRIWA